MVAENKRFDVVKVQPFTTSDVFVAGLTFVRFTLEIQQKALFSTVVRQA